MPPEPQADYAYLLGLYLGDGCIGPAGARDKKVWKLRIACADAWPGLRCECERAMSAVRPGNKVRTQQQIGCTEVISCSRHWPCLFPQHGPGRKHMRKIELQPWQRTIVTAHAGRFAAACSTRMVIAVLTGYGHLSRTATTGMSIRDICSRTSRRTLPAAWLAGPAKRCLCAATPSAPWHHPCRSRTAWMPQPCRQSCMVAASMQYERDGTGGGWGIRGHANTTGAHGHQE
jgi:hypothetical protein